MQNNLELKSHPRAFQILFVFQPEVGDSHSTCPTSSGLGQDSGDTLAQHGFSEGFRRKQRLMICGVWGALLGLF